MTSGFPLSPVRIHQWASVGVWTWQESHSYPFSQLWKTHQLVVCVRDQDFRSIHEWLSIRFFCCRRQGKFGQRRHFGFGVFFAIFFPPEFSGIVTVCELAGAATDIRLLFPPAALWAELGPNERLEWIHVWFQIGTPKDPPILRHKTCSFLYF